MTIDALVDSNVIVASIALTHLHHEPSHALLNLGSKNGLAVTAHSFAEAYATLTRQGPHGFRLTSQEAWAGLEAVKDCVALVGMTAPQCLNTIRHFAEQGGVGARLYDALIGETAVRHGIPAIITWNTRHMVGLFPTLLVATPQAFLAR